MRRRAAPQALAVVLLALAGGAGARPICGDLDQGGAPGDEDGRALRRHLAGVEPLALLGAQLCDVIDEVRAAGLEPDPLDPAGRCSLADAVVLARHAAGLAPATGDACALGSGAPCGTAHGGVGCEEPAAALCACAADLSCCTASWSESCAAAAATPACAGVKLLATGDTGEGNLDQHLVADAMDARCADAGGCAGVLLAGDNIYDNGVSSVTDPQWATKFEAPYDRPNLAVPFYAVLGNHDYGPSSTGSAQAQLDYALLPVGVGPGERPSDRWNMPASFYDVVFGANLVHVFFLDTQSVFPLPAIDVQLPDMQARAAGSTALWKVVVGHHPRFTSGDHQLDNLLLDEASQLANPPGLFALLEGVYCGADLYIAGHDHDREFIDRGRDPGCPDTHFAVSGAGSKLRSSPFPPIAGQLFYDDTVEGFAYLAFSSAALHFEFWDKDGTLDFCRVIPR